MIKLLVSDFDGTLFGSEEQKLDKSIAERIDTLVGNGVVFTVSSGRSYSGLRKFFSGLENKIPFISFDGALVTVNDNVVFQKTFSPDSIEYIFNCALGEGSHTRFMSKDCTYSIGDTNNKFPSDIKITKRFDIKEPIYKVEIFGKTSVCAERDFRLHYEDALVKEFVPAFANKGVALGALQRHLGISLYDTLAMGDNDNDIPMMKNAKYSVCVGDKCMELKRMCNVLTNSAKEILDKVWLGSNLL